MPEQGEPLSEREAELLRLVATGATNRQIAQDLRISVNTVKVHVRNILAKLGAASRTEATVVAVRQGLVTVDGAGVSADESRRETVVGPGEELSAIEASPAGEPVLFQPALPWPKRLALVVVPLLVAAATALTSRSAALPQGMERDDLPPESPQEQAPAPNSTGADSRWRTLAQMPTQRAYFGLAAVGGQLVAIGGRTIDGATSAVEVYDPLRDIWSRGADKPSASAYVSAGAVGPLIYVPGGCDADFRPTRNVEAYSPESDAWQTTAPLPEPRCAYALAVREGVLYVLGGWDGDEYAASTYVYEAAANVWREGVPMSEPRGFAAAAALDNDIYVVGGYDGRRELTTCARLGTEADAWQACSPLTLGRGGLGLTALGQQLFAIGGGGWESYLGFNERYEPETDTWHPIETPLTGEWRSPGIGVLDYSVYAVGGWNSGYLSLNQAYDVLRYRIFIPVSEAQ